MSRNFYPKTANYGFRYSLDVHKRGSDLGDDYFLMEYYQHRYFHFDTSEVVSKFNVCVFN